ncbi:MAG: hypothetical protein Kow0077_02860 [Anaerolineae bacterium]
MEPQTSVSLAQIGLLMGVLMLAAIGLLMAAFFMTRRRAGSQSRQKRRAPAPAQRTPSAAAARPPEGNPGRERPLSALSTAGVAPVQGKEVLRIYRDDSDQGLVFVVDQVSYRTLGDLKQAGKDRAFMALLREVAKLVKETGDVITDPAPSPEPPPVAPLPPKAPAPEQAPQPSLEELTGQPIAPRVPDTPPEEAEPLGSFFDNVRRVVQPGSGGTKTKYQEPASIPEQIEAILQLKLLSSEKYRGRKIHIRAAATGGVQILVEDRVYEAVGDIEDDGVRLFVQEAIRDWERQHD